ncbi:NB-ARC domain-containing protein [Actinoplanes sp. CA-030573]|uniref:NB-ARC domain-containing protein n=1 Tax=Actinoplanes sp. CA-030573 TaxID=3239898 RepID=UPI003D911A34
MRRWTQVSLMVMAAVIASAAAALATVAGNASTGSPVAWLPSMSRHYLLWLVASVLAMAGAALFGWWTQRRYERGLRDLIPAAQQPESWMVDRPAEIGAVVRALCRRHGPSTVGVTTAVQGAGGFGKSTVARMVRADRRLLRTFGGRVYWVTVGRDVRRGALAEKVNDLVRQIEPAQAQPFTDVGQAADHLAKVLADGPRRLIILDDVWFSDQLAAFPVAGRCARLVTTRVTSLIAAAGVTVRVDQMPVGQARRVLTADLPPLPARVTDGLMDEAGRWPLLLRLINKILVDQTQLRDASDAAGELLNRLRRDGALQVDAWTGAAGRQVDVTDPEQRRLAVAATIEASAGLLDAQGRDRLAELSIFIEDETIPIALVAALWKATAGSDTMVATALCARLGDLALLTVSQADGAGTVGLHDVVRDYFRGELGEERLRALNDVLLQAVATDLPRERPVISEGESAGAAVIAWWRLPESARYLWDHLIGHLKAANRTDEAEATAADLRWIEGRLEQSDATGPFVDLAQFGTARAVRLARLFGQIAHLLGPTRPAHSRADILYSRVAHDPDWGRQSAALAVERAGPALRNRWALPDLAPSDLRRTITGHGGRVAAVVVSPDGSWLASGARDGLVRVWDAATGQMRTVLEGHTSGVTALAMSPEGTWIASGARDGLVSIWDAATGQQRTVLDGHSSGVTALAASPHGTWLAAGEADGTLRIWDIVTRQQRTEWTRRASSVTALVVAPQGSWIAIGASDGSLWMLDVATGRQRGALTGRPGNVNAIAVAPNGEWLATAGDDGPIEVWDLATGQQRTTLTGHSGHVRAMSVAPDSRWLVSAGDDGVCVWDIVTGKRHTMLAGGTEVVTAVAIAADGAWMVTGSADGLLQIWDGITGRPSEALTNHAGRVTTVTAAPDGSWIATGGSSFLRIWDAASGLLRTAVTGHTATVTAVAPAPDSTWVVGACRDGSVGIWDAATGQLRIGLAGHAGEVTTVAVSPDGTWLATASRAGWIRIWEAATGQLRSALGPHPKGVNKIAVAPDGAWLIAVGNDGSAQIWDVATGRPRTRLMNDTRRAYCVAIASDGTWLAIGGDNGSLWVWETATHRRRVQLLGHAGRVNSAAIAPDGSRLATVSNDRTIRIWDSKSGTAIAMMRIDARPRDCAWSPCGRRLIVGGEAGVYNFDLQIRAAMSSAGA